MRNYLVDYQLSKIVHTSYIYLFYYRCIYRCAWKVKGSCATPHLKPRRTITPYMYISAHLCPSGLSVWV